MLCFLIIGLLASWVTAQNGRGPQHLDHNGHGWDIRLAVPGDPGSDYPTLNSIPRTTFSCSGREPGYYADIDTNCQVFRVCTVGSTYGFQSFLCPNGTLFNQAVFVCDWWMNVNCESTEQFVRNNNEQFENLRLGPQLMKDIKKMLTHPMRNPYDKVSMKSNYIVMQDYKPPTGQLFPNGALLAGPDRTPTMVYVPKQNYINSDTTFSGSTPLPKYTTIRPTTFRNSELFQKQQLNGQYTQNNKLRTQNLLSSQSISKGSPRHLSQYKNSDFISTNGKTHLSKQNNSQKNMQKPQRLTNNLGNIKNSNFINKNRGQLNRQNGQYTVSKKPATIKNSPKQTEQNYAINQEKQLQTNKTSFTQFPYELAEEIQNEVKQNVVSKFNNITPTITKTLAFSRTIDNPKPGKPKSRIIVKTWIVKPTKSARLIASPSSYTYESVTQSPYQNLINETSPYVYEKPTTQLQTEAIISKPSPTPYIYNTPIFSVRQKITTKSDFNENNWPFLPSTQIPRTTPTPKKTIGSISSGQLDVLPTIASATQTPQLYLGTITLKPSPLLYLPPQNIDSSRQYLSPIIQTPLHYSNKQFNDISSSSTPAIVPDEMRNIATIPFTTEMPIPSTSKSRFADVLTKDSIDKSVNSIVKDTKDILKTASPNEFIQYDQKFNGAVSSEGDPNTYAVTDSGESLTSQLPTMDSKLSRIIALPSTQLEPPDKSLTIENTNNKLSRLPFFKESLLPPANTIERTVSLRIKIPEKLAAYLFRNSNERNYDKLEILNTENSNYLVLGNNMVKANPKLNQLETLASNENSNISNSQALVFSLLADSINAAKEYSNVAQQEVLSSTSTPTQFQNINNNDLSQITNMISQLTTSQFSGNNEHINENIVAPVQTSSSTRGYQIINDNIQNINNRQVTPEHAPVQTMSQDSQQLKNFLQPPQQQIQENYYARNSYQLKSPNTSANLLANNNQIYSGQLYQFSVPEVTNQIYNSPFLPDLTQTSSTSQNNIPTNIPPSTNNPINLIQPTLDRNIPNPIVLSQNQNNIARLSNKQPSFEIVQSRTIPFAPTKVQLEPTNESNSVDQETVNDLLNSDDGISAQLIDKIIGTIPHPLENNKLVTYEKNQSYFLTTKLNNSRPRGNAQVTSFSHSNIVGEQNNTPGKNINPYALTFQVIPSFGYHLNNENDQQQLLNAFRIDEFGAPRDVIKSNFQDNNQNEIVMTSNIDYSVDHSKSAKQVEASSNLNALYSGPPSYFTPQLSIGSLRQQQVNIQSAFNSRLEDLDGNSEEGYPKTRPSRQFTF